MDYIVLAIGLISGVIGIIVFIFADAHSIADKLSGVLSERQRYGTSNDSYFKGVIFLSVLILLCIVLIIYFFANFHKSVNDKSNLTDTSNKIHRKDNLEILTDSTLLKNENDKQLLQRNQTPRITEIPSLYDVLKINALKQSLMFERKNISYEYSFHHRVNLPAYFEFLTRLEKEDKLEMNFEARRAKISAYFTRQETLEIGLHLYAFDGDITSSRGPYELYKDTTILVQEDSILIGVTISSDDICVQIEINGERFMSEDMGIDDYLDKFGVKIKGKNSKICRMSLYSLNAM